MAISVHSPDYSAGGMTLVPTCDSVKVSVSALSV